MPTDSLNDSARGELNAMLLVLKNQLRQLEGAIRDAELAASSPDARLPPSAYNEISSHLRKDAADLRQRIGMLESERTHLLNLS